MKKGSVENGVMVWRDERGEICEAPPSRMDWTQGDAPLVETDRDALFRNVYDPGLGVRLRGREHRRELMKEKGLVAIG